MLQVIIVVLAIAVLYLVARKPKFDLKKFEKVYDSAISRFGGKNAEIVIASVKLAAEALSAQFTAANELKQQITNTVASAQADKEYAHTVVSTADEKAAKLEAKAAAKAAKLQAKADKKRDDADYTAQCLRSSAAQKQTRVVKLTEMEKFMS